MDYFKDKLTRKELIDGFHIIIMFVYIFSVLRVLRLIPSWDLFMNTWDLIGSIAYSLGFLLVESVIITALLALLCLLLPRKWIKGYFVLYSTLFILGWTMLVSLVNFMELYLVRYKLYVCFCLFYLVLVLITRKSEEVRRSFDQLPARVIPLSTLYIALGLISWFIILLRNTIL